MVKAALGVLVSCGLLCSTPVFSAAPQSSDEAAAAYDGTGVQPPKELLLQEGRTIGDIRLPKNTKIDDKKSIILGSGANAFGKILASVKAESDMVSRFFLDTMPSDGWEILSQFQADDTTMAFQKPTRVVIVFIERGKRATNIKIVLTPRS